MNIVHDYDYDCGGILNIVHDYDNMGQYLNLIEPDCPLSLSFSFYGTSKLIQNAYFQVQTAVNW